jgi:hypothetical protein
MYKRKNRIYLYVILILFLLAFLAFRKNLLEWGIQKVIEKVKAETEATLTIGTAGFSGLTSVCLQDLEIVPFGGDTLFSADSLDVRISIWTLFVGTIRIKEINGSGIRINISCKDNICNYSGILHPKKGVDKKSEKNYSRLIKGILDKAFNLAPQKAMLKDIYLKFQKNDSIQMIYFPVVHSDENSVNGSVSDILNHTSWEWNGKFSQVKKSFTVNIFPITRHSLLPFTKELTGISAGFDTLHLALHDYNLSGSKLALNGKVYVKSMLGFHEKISDDTIRIPFAEFSFRFNVDKTSFELDSSSVAKLDSITFYPFVRYVSSNEKEYILRIRSASTLSNNFFSSLPAGIFDEVRDIKANGTLAFNLLFDLKSSQPDSVIFEAGLQKDKFRLLHTGSSNLYKINEEFTQNVYEKNRLVRTFSVGSTNPYYTPLEAVSPYFINSLLTSEDGNFFTHNGFNEEAFRKSIVANYKAGKFARGGSTISMQLVKNVFLTRKKTIARKAEEALLVWLIENNRTSSKQRMLEVYVNIIELGPSIYGIGEAASFYFNKTPSEISLPEGIFLAGLLPRPKWFKYNFDTLGNLKPYLADYYKSVSSFMLRKNLITQQEFDLLQPNVNITGPAREFIIPRDTLIPIEELQKSFIRQ